MSEQVHIRELIPPGPIDIERTLGTGHGSRDPTVWRDEQGLWRAMRTAEGPVTLDVCRLAKRVVARAWGAGAEALLGRVDELLGFHDDPSALVPKHALVRDLQRRFPGLRLGRGRGVLDEMIPVILGQRVTTGEAHDSYRHLVMAFGERAPGPTKMRLPPAPEKLRSLSLPDYHRFGVEASRARVIVEACRHEAFVERAREMAPKDAVAHLCKLPGVGAWTANITAAATLGHADAVVTGDYHLPHAVCFALAGEPRGDDRRMLELLEPYRGQRWRVTRLIKAGGPGAPRRGPKRAGFETLVAIASERAARRARG